MKKLAPLFLVLFLLSCRSSSDSTEQTDVQPPEGTVDDQLAFITEEGNYQDESDRLKDMFETYIDWQYESSPITGTFMGNNSGNDRWDDLSPAGYKKATEDMGKFHEIRESFNPEWLSKEDRDNIGILSTYLENTYELNSQFPENYSMIDQIQGVHILLPSLLQMMPKSTEKDLADMKTRLDLVPTLFDQIEETLTEAIEKDIMMPKTTQAGVPAQLRALISEDPEKSAFYQAFSNLPSDNGGDIAAYQEEIKLIISEKVNPALEEFLEFYESEYFPNTRETYGLSELPNGEAWYNARIKGFTTTDMTAQEIHDLGQSEVARIREEMIKVKDEAGFKGDLEAFNNFLRTDPQFYFETAEDLLKEYRDICKRLDAELPRLFGKLPKLPYGVIAVPSYQEQSTTTAYYNPGSIENGTPGYFYANTYNLKSRPKWEMEALSVHEAVPGHHLQIALAQEMEDTPEFRKTMFFTAFIEGWGLYSESLGPELGMYKDPYSKYGQLTYEMWRAIRLVVDTGIHAFGWTRQDAIDFFKANTGKSEQDIAVEVDRYIAWPGQALAYKIGELKIKELKQKAKDELGDKFDIRGFHDTVLGSGAIPLDVLEANINAWIDEVKAGEES